MSKIRCLLRKFNCHIGNHEWTSASEEGIEPTREQLENVLEEFKDYAKMYCKHCGHISALGLELLKAFDPGDVKHAEPPKK